MTLILQGIIKFALSIAESFKNIHCRNMCELFKSDSSPLKKSWRKLETVCPCIFLRVKVFANFNTSAYFSFIPSLRNIANVVLGSINWFSFEKVVFVMRMRLKMMCSSKEILAKETIQKTAIFHYPIIFRWFGLLFLRQYDHLDVKK